MDATLARVDLAAVVVGPEASNDWSDPPTPIVPVMRAALAKLHDGAAMRFAREPKAFPQAFMADVIDAPTPGVPAPDPLTWDFGKRPIVTVRDVGDFMLQDYFGPVKAGIAEPLRRLHRYLGGLDRPDCPPFECEGYAEKAPANQALRAEMQAILAEP